MKKLILVLAMVFAIAGSGFAQSSDLRKVNYQVKENLEEFIVTYTTTVVAEYNKTTEDFEVKKTTENLTTKVTFNYNREPGMKIQTGEVFFIITDLKLTDDSDATTYFYSAKMRGDNVTVLMDDKNIAILVEDTLIKFM